MLAKMTDRYVLLTGATGFVGSELVKQLSPQKLKVLGRSNPAIDDAIFCEAGIDGSSVYSAHLEDVKCIIHSAARAHIMNDTVANPLEEFRKVNTFGTLNLAQQAAIAGVKRFIFVSSIKVSGESTQTGKPFRHSDKPSPEDAYGISKYEAEEGLKKIAEETGMEVVIIRPTLVYGPGVKANFLSLVNLVRKRIPLPLGLINNQRSLVAIDNLVDLIVTCIDHPNAANETFLVSDDDDVSTTELLKRIGTAFVFKPMLLPIPRWALTIPAAMLGKKSVVDRLYGSLQVDISHTKHRLNWTPPVTMGQQLAKIADSFNSK